MNELILWLLVFLRVSALLTVFPIFSAANFPVQLRIALGALLSALIFPNVSLPETLPIDYLGMTGLMAREIAVGLVFGFVSSLIFHGLDAAGTLISSELGLSMPPSFNPMTNSSTMAPGSILYYLAAMIWLSMDFHHWMLVGIGKTFQFIPIGTAVFGQALLNDMIHRTSLTFVIALHLAAPLLAVSFIISLIFAVLGRAVPQMNVFQDSISVKALAGMGVFGMTMQLMSQHIINYLRQLPEDMLHVAQLLHTG